MFRWKTAMVSVVTGLLVMAWVGGVFSQEAPAQPRGGRRGGRFNMEEMRQRMADRMKELLAATDEEWQILQPRVENVQTLSRQARSSGGMGMLFGRGRRRGGAPTEGAEARELSAVEKAVEQLQKTLEDENAAPDQIRKDLTALRGAREKARQELEKAQKELRELVTLRQEAQLVLLGLLD